jgi:hypothetical protein
MASFPALPSGNNTALGSLGNDLENAAAGAAVRRKKKKKTDAVNPTGSGVDSSLLDNLNAASQPDEE